MRPMHPAVPTAGAVLRPTPTRLQIAADDVVLEAELQAPDDASGVIVFVHGNGSSRHSARDRAVAETLRSVGFATLQFDLRTPEEESLDRIIGWLRFDAERLGRRVCAVVDWLRTQPAWQRERIGLFASGSGAAVALVAAARMPDRIAALVCRAGRTDLADDVLDQVRTPTLLLAGEQDSTMLTLNRQALPRLAGDKEFALISGGDALLGTPEATEQVAALASTWLRGFLGSDFGLH